MCAVCCLWRETLLRGAWCGKPRCCTYLNFVVLYYCGVMDLRPGLLQDFAPLAAVPGCAVILVFSFRPKPVLWGLSWLFLDTAPLSVVSLFVLIVPVRLVCRRGLARNLGQAACSVGAPAVICVWCVVVAQGQCRGEALIVTCSAHTLPHAPAIACSCHFSCL